MILLPFLNKAVLIVIFLLFLSSVQAIDYPYHPTHRIDFTSSNLPIVVIDLDAPMKAKNLDERVSATITILNRKDGSRNKMSDLNGIPDFSDRTIFDYRGKIGIKYRGNTSFSESAKKPFSVRTEDGNGKKMDINVLGMGAHDNWTLLAPYSDKSLIRDVLTFDLQRGYFEYTPPAKYCELVLEGVYQGVYIMAARARRGKNRIDLPKPGLSGDALTGGYLLEIDRADTPGFYLTHKPLRKDGQPYGIYPYVQYKYPDPEDIQEEQEIYIQDFMKRFEDALAGDDFKDPVTGYRAYLDDMSAIDYMLTEEFTHNIDGYRLSTPIYKYNDSRDPRLKFTIWDFNISLGNTRSMDCEKYYGWGYLELNEYGQFNAVPFWFQRLMADEAFVLKFRERWCLYRSTSHSDGHIVHKIDSLVALLNEAQERNFRAWNILGTYVWPNYFIGSTWEEEIGYLKNYIEKRTVWIDQELELRLIETEEGTAMPSVACKGVNVRLSAASPPQGMVFDCWTGDVGLLTNPYSATTTFVMPDMDVAFYASFKKGDIGSENIAPEDNPFLYPGLADDYIRIGGVENISYAIIDRLGQVLIAAAGYNGEAIDVSFLQPGVYIVRTEAKALLFIKK